MEAWLSSSELIHLLLRARNKHSKDGHHSHTSLQWCLGHEHSKLSVTAAAKSQIKIEMDGKTGFDMC